MPRLWRVVRTVPFTAIGVLSFMALILLSIMGEGAFARSLPGLALTAVLWPLMLPAYVVSIFTMPALDPVLGYFRPPPDGTWWVLLPFRLLFFAAVDVGMAGVRWYLRQSRGNSCV